VVKSKKYKVYWNRILFAALIPIVAIFLLYFGVIKDYEKERLIKLGYSEEEIVGIREELTSEEIKNLEIQEFNVTFNSDGGSKVTTQTIEEGKVATKPTNPTKETFKFVEWTLDGKAFDFKTKITDDITLKATWKEKAKYTITFVNQGQTVDTKTIYEGDVLGTLPTVTRTDYVFAGWWNGNTKYTAKTAITLKEGTNALTLTAKWDEVVHVYKYVVTKVDDYSTDRYISIYEDGKFISTPTQILFTNGSLLSKTKEDGKFVVGDADLDYLDVSGNIKVKLASGKVVTATK